MTVTVTNQYKHATGKLVVEKILAGGYADWGVDNTTPFEAEVWDNGPAEDPFPTAQRLRLIKTESGYRCVGNDVDGLSEPLPPGTDWTNVLTLTAGQVIVTNLWANHVYEVVESVDPRYFEAAYQDNHVTIITGASHTVKVTNTYKSGRADTEISGTIITQGWERGLKEFWLNLTEVKSEKDRTPVGGGYVNKVKTDGDGGFTFDVTELLIGDYYFVIEVEGKESDDHGWTHSKKSYLVKIEVKDDGNGNVIVEIIYIDGNIEFTNIYETGKLTVMKSLDGFYADWDINESSVFRARIKDQVTGKYVTLSGTAPNYTYTGLSTEGTELTFTAGRSSVIADMPVGLVYIVEEVAGANYQTKYTGNGIAIVLDAKIPMNSNQTVTVTNTYKARKATAEISGKKAIKGIKSTTKKFTFDLKQVSKNGKEIRRGYSDSITITGAGRFTFAISGLEIGEYYYKITERLGGTTSGGWSYDANAMIVKVTVAESKGAAAARVTSVSGSSTFTNTYQKTENTTIVIDEKEKLTGKENVSLHLKKSLIDKDGQEVGAGKKFVLRLYDNHKNLVDRIILSANEESIVIDGLRSGTTYYLAEEQGKGFTDLSIEVVGISEVKGTVVGLQIPEIQADNRDIHVIVKNRADNLSEISDEIPPLGWFELPRDIPMIEIPDDESSSETDSTPGDESSSETDSTPPRFDSLPTGDNNRKIIYFIALALSFVLFASAMLIKGKKRNRTDKE